MTIVPKMIHNFYINNAIPMSFSTRYYEENRFTAYLFHTLPTSVRITLIGMVHYRMESVLTPLSQELFGKYL